PQQPERLQIIEGAMDLLAPRRLDVFVPREFGRQDADRARHGIFIDQRTGALFHAGDGRQDRTLLLVHRALPTTIPIAPTPLRPHAPAARSTTPPHRTSREYRIVTLREWGSSAV